MTTMHIGADALALCTAIAEEIRGFGTRLEEVVGSLIVDERIAMDHLDTLQAFDFLAQHAAESAAVLRRVLLGEDIHAALGDVRLAVVQDRLRAALG
ncbi:MAG TPA: hypothetical protein VF503_04100 [Sphingobium sp.]|uniref:hypothetical protein n=1 Tax=Sphingobium sp. TaxID=1912891 RepID=UPI002ED2DDFC